MKKISLFVLAAVSFVSASAQTFPMLGTVLPNKTKNVLVNNMPLDTKLKISNTGLADLEFCMGSSTTANCINKGTVVNAGKSIEITLQDLGATVIQTALNVTNITGDALKAGAFNLDRIGKGIIDLGGIGGVGDPVTNCNNTIPPALPTTNWYKTIQGNNYFLCPSGNVGIGTNAPAYMLDVAGEARVSSIRSTLGGYISGATTFNGYVGIGTSPSSTYRLVVDGTIGAREVIIQTGPFPDYVFAKDYKLCSLKALEAYINEHHHLPNVPSAAEVEANNGVKLGELNTKLLEKVEELTLYMIEQNKRLEQQEKEIQALKAKTHK